MFSLSLRAKLLLIIVLPILFFALSVIFLINMNSSNIEKLKTTLYETSYQVTSHVLNADRDMYQALDAYNRLQAEALSEEERSAIYAEFQENVQQAVERIQSAGGILNAEHTDNLTHAESGTPVSQYIQGYQNDFDKWVQLAESRIQAGQSTSEQTKVLLDQFNASRDEIDLIGQIVSQYAEREIEAILAERTQTNWALGIVFVIEWIALIAFGSFMIRRISSTARKVLEKTTRISEGDLKHTPESKYSKDELGQIVHAVDLMTMKIRGLVEEIASSSKAVAGSAQELSIGAKESAAATNHVAENIQDVTFQIEQQTAIVEQSSTAMDEMAIGVGKIADNTTAISEQSSIASGQIDHGSDRVQSLKEQLGNIGEAVGMLSEIVKSLTDKSEKIGAITENITAFANQTNILSFNASIEAVRAGEHGKGFAVVAQEIRKLAESSLESADVINRLVAETRSEIGNVSENMQSTLAQSQQGMRLMEEVDLAFAAILRSVKQVVSQIHETSAVTEQMSASSEEISASMEQAAGTAREVSGKAQTVAASTEEQLALAENIATASDRLQEIVARLNRSVGSFKW
ncbi:methyl-accepting chemotaxis protein [Cohnella massiliensis]|uniref:methyl-accepting chemotaxis protein n=1 Tax=Cohnella massiliensis TaxID=1816691 RepID=UPI0015949513|nr:methyl-accepting chemotaxis protein [Cohnella massiliensis]